MTVSWLTMSIGNDTAIDISQITTNITPVRFSVVLTCRGRNTAMKRSHEIAQSVKTLLVKHVAERG